MSTKKPHSPWLGSVSGFDRFFALRTGFGRGNRETDTGFRSPVARMADTPRFGLLSRVRPAHAVDVENVRDSGTTVFVREGARKSGIAHAAWRKSRRENDRNEKPCIFRNGRFEYADKTNGDELGEGRSVQWSRTRFKRRRPEMHRRYPHPVNCFRNVSRRDARAVNMRRVSLHSPET